RQRRDCLYARAARCDCRSHGYVQPLTAHAQHDGLGVNNNHAPGSVQMVPKIRRCVFPPVLTLACFALFAPAHAQGALIVYCGVNEDWCRGAATTFERETGVKVAMTRKSSGELYAQLKAEA